MKINMKMISIIFSLLLSQYAYALTQESHPFTSQTDALRFQSLTKEIRCVVCQSQSISESNAPLANDLREKVYTMIIEKKSDADIKEFLVKRYGEFILLQPRFNKLTWILWLFPCLCLIVIGWILHRMKRPA